MNWKPKVDPRLGRANKGGAEGLKGASGDGAEELDDIGKGGGSGRLGGTVKCELYIFLLDFNTIFFFFFLFIVYFFILSILPAL